MKSLLASLALIAGQIGAPLPVPPPAVSVSAPLSADGYVSGSGNISCSGPRGSGMRSGWITLQGNVNVRTSDGATGTVAVGGSVFVNGSCSNDSGFVNGSGTVSGSSPVYGRDGKYAGRAELSGTVFVNQYASGFYVWVNNQHVSFSGRVD